MKSAGGARRGLGLWLAQRASAAVMLFYLPGFLIYVVLAAPLDHAAWRGLFVPVTAKVASLLFAAAVLLHAWIGLREILIDYLHALAVRLALLFLFAALYAGCLLWAIEILWGVR